MTVAAVKFVDGTDGRIEGAAIPFGSLSSKDLQRQFFTAKTDYCLDWLDHRPLLYHHGLNAALKTTLVGRQSDYELRDQTAGGSIWVQAELNKRSRYLKEIQQLVQEEAVGFSSGSLPHLVQVNKTTGEITRWPWVELSLTPTPANNGAVVYAVKTADALKHIEKVGNEMPDALKAALAALETTDEQGDDTGPESFDTQAERVASDVGSLLERAQKRMDLRAAKVGRELNTSNRTWLTSLYERLADVEKWRREVKELLDRTDPDAKKAMEELETELLVSELRRSGIAV